MLDYLRRSWLSFVSQLLDVWDTRSGRKGSEALPEHTFMQQNSSGWLLLRGGRE